MAALTMFSFIKSFIARYKKTRLQNNQGDPRKKEQEIPEIENLGKALQYNTSHVPLFAPQGFPNWSKIDTPCDSKEFVYDVARAQECLDLKVDGICGPKTINAIAKKDRNNSSSIIIGPRAYDLGQSLNKSLEVITYLDDPKLSELSSRRRTQDIKQVVLHYDVAFNAESTLSVLRNRGLSYNFLVDGNKEATIYQTHNPTLEVCFHAGIVNNYSIGICMNNPASPKYQDQDAQRRGRKREVKEDVIHGRNELLLSFFDEQIEATRLLVKKITEVLDIPFKVPFNSSDDEGKIIKTTLDDIQDYEGILGHYHISKTKKDPAPLDWSKFLE